MRFLVAIRAAIADHQQSVVSVGGMAQRREYDTAGDDPRQDQSLDAVGTQYQVEIGRGEGAHPMLGDDDFLGQRRDSGWIFALSAPATSAPEALSPLNVAFRSLTSG
jgi:hypothetical protein